MSEPKVEAKCISCGHKHWIGPGEVEPGGVPECPKCWDIMVATGRAKA